MYFVDAYRPDGHLPPMQTIDDEASVQAAEMASLDEVAWGLTYPDLIWTVAPFLKDVVAWPLRAMRGQELVDRGTALENAWRRTDSLKRATLDMWRRDLAAAVKPAVLFNATIAETGQQVLLGTTTMSASHGRIDFATDTQFQDADVAVVTAARLSATFPIVSPPARIERRGRVTAASISSMAATTTTTARRHCSTGWSRGFANRRNESPVAS